MHFSIDRKKLVHLAQAKSKYSWIGLIGSAAGDGARYRSESDIDLVAIGERSGFSYTSYNGRVVEVHQYDKGKLENIRNRPEWFGLNWPWELGKFINAETLFGDAPDASPSATSRAVALVGTVGNVIGARKKFGDGRIQRTDISHAMCALKNLVRETYALIIFA